MAKVSQTTYVANKAEVTLTCIDDFIVSVTPLLTKDIFIQLLTILY